MTDPDQKPNLDYRVRALKFQWGKNGVLVLCLDCGRFGPADDYADHDCTCPECNPEPPAPEPCAHPRANHP